MTALFEQIDNSNLVKDGEVNPNVVDSMSVIDILDFAEQSKEITIYQDSRLPKDLFTHAASESMSAAAWPCESPRCRLTKALNLAQYAAFYSDKVYIQNFVANHLKHLESEKYPNESVMKNRFFTDLVVLQALRPIIEAGIIVPVSFDNCCTSCFIKEVLKKESDESLKHSLSALAIRYAAELTYTVYCDDQGLYNLRMTGPEELLEHGYLANLSQNPFPCITHDRKIRKAVQQGREVTVPRSWVEKMKLDISLAEHSFQNAIFGLRSAQVIGSHFITDRSLDVSLANDIASDSNLINRNSIIQEHLTSLVPYLENVNPSEILHIRRNDEDAFVRFRQVLNDAVNECSASNPRTFTKQDAVSIFQDVLRPELSRLDQVARHAQKSVLKGTTHTAVACTAAIVFGYFTGLLPLDLLATARALGLVKVVSDLTRSTLKSADASKEMQASPIYFLWKIKRESQKWKELEEKHKGI